MGFFGSAGFGASVNIGEYNATTWITNSNGSVQGPQADNIQFLNAGSGYINGSTSGTALRLIPNYQATVNIRFTHSSAVQTQNAEVRIYDRVNINNAASGVTVKTAELIHSWNTQSPLGSGDTSWTTPAGSSIKQTLTNSPGMSGRKLQSTDIQHDWYLAISASPDSVGSKTQFGLYCSLEYL